ncbi:MAG: hypothetical protein ABI056_03620 [Caulobacteraceae bacterium]
MNRTVAALYENRDVAERVAAALKAEGLGNEVEIRDAEHEDAKRHPHGLGGWLSDLFGGHDDHHIYTEGLRRGQVLVVAKVDALNETRAASTMDAAAVNLGAVQSKWQGEGWASGTASAERHARSHTGQDRISTFQGATAGRSYVSTFGGVRAYTL